VGILSTGKIVVDQLYVECALWPVSASYVHFFGVFKYGSDFALHR